MQVFHICNDGRKISFLCPNGTIFQQSDLICEWWFKVNCTNSPNLYEESAEHLKEDIRRRKANRRVVEADHGAVMRTEEHQSVSVSSQSARNFEVHSENKQFLQSKERTSGPEQQKSSQRSVNERKDQTVAKQPLGRGNQRYESSFSTNFGEKKSQYDVNYQQHDNKAGGSYGNNYGNSFQGVSNGDYSKNYDNNKHKPKSNEKPIPGKQQNVLSGTINRNDLINKKLVPSDSEESQITQETASFYKNNANNIQSFSKQTSLNPYPNHRKTYSDLKKPEEYSSTSVTAGPYSTSTINNGQPFVGKTDANSYVSNNIISTTPGYEKQRNTKQLAAAVVSSTASVPLSNNNYYQYSTTLQTPNRKATAAPPFGARINLNYQKAYTPTEKYYQSTNQNYYNTQKTTTDSNVYTTFPPQFTYSTTPQVTQRVFYNLRSDSSTYQTNNRFSNIDSTTVPSIPSSENYGFSVTTDVPSTYQGYSDIATTTNAPITTQSWANYTSNIVSTVDDKGSFSFTFGASSTEIPDFSKNKNTYFNTGATAGTNANSFNLNLANSFPATVTQNSATETTTNLPATSTFASLGISTVNPQSFNAGTTEKYSTSDVATTTELFNTGNAHSTASDIFVPSTPSPELYFVTKKYDSSTVTDNGLNDYPISSPRPFQYGSKTDDSSVSLNTASKNNFLANGLRDVSTPKVVIGIIQNSEKNSTKKYKLRGEFENERNKTQASGGFYVTKSVHISPQTTASTLYTNNLERDVQQPSKAIQPPHFVSKQVVLRPKPFAAQSPTSPTQEVNSVFNNLFNTGATSKTDFETTTTGSTTFSTYDLSSARPFQFNTVSTLPPTEPTSPTIVPTPSPLSVYENVDNMINALMEIAGGSKDGVEGETARPGLVIPPSVGPQTLHSLAVYFANALDNIAAGRQLTQNYTETTLPTTTNPEMEQKVIDALLTHSTADKYKELFGERVTSSDESTTLSPSNTESDNDLDTENSINPVQTTPRIRQLAQVFTQALSAYLDDPATFRRVLEEVRPTEPPQVTDKYTGTEEDELLNFSDAEVTARNRLTLPTVPSVLNASPTWGYIIAPLNTSEVRSNSIGSNENLQSADSQSFVSQFNSLSNDDKLNVISTTLLPPAVENVKSFNEAFETPSTTVSDLASTEENKTLLSNHWTDSPDATKLWQSTLFINPSLVNENFDTKSPARTTAQDSTEISTVPSTTTPLPTSEIQYELRALPKLELNSTAVHGILIDFMNKSDDSAYKLQRILKKLNTTENEFLSKMREIESNPLTRRLILLLISECGVNATKEIDARVAPVQSLLNYAKDTSSETLEQSSSNAAVLSTQSSSSDKKLKNSSYKEIVDHSLDEDEQDTRALQLLNSLYTIASRWGK